MDTPLSQINELLNKLPRSKGAFEPVLIVRLLVSAALLAVTLLVEMLPVFEIILTLLSVLIAGYDILLDLVDSIMDRELFSAPVIIVLISVLSFLIGYIWEGALVVIMYQFAIALLHYAAERTRRSAQELLDRTDGELASRASVVMETAGAGDMNLEKEIGKSTSLVLKCLMGLAVLFAVLMPIITSLSVRDSIYRALILFTLCLPFSVLVSFPLAGIIGIGFATHFGVLFNNAKVIEKLQGINTVVLDKSGIFADNHPEFIGVKSEILDEKTFMEFVAHAVYYSDQAFAKAILAAEDREFRLDLISDFKDIPGSGVDVKIGGTNVTLAKRELLTERGEAVPYESKDENSVYYLMVAGKYIGKVLLAENLNKNNTSLISDLKASGLQKCVLLTEDSKEESEALGISLNADEVYSEFTDGTKLQYLETLDGNQTMYVYANSLEAHSSAAVDIRVSRKGKYADALISPDELELFPEAFKLSRRIREVCIENAILAFLIKAILVFLALTGHCTIWFALFLEFVVATAAILNTIRVTKNPLFKLPDL